MGVSPTGIAGGDNSRTFTLQRRNSASTTRPSGTVDTKRWVITVSVALVAVLLVAGGVFVVLGGDETPQPPQEAAASQDDVNETETESGTETESPADATGISQVYTDTFDEPAVSTGLSSNGSTAAVGLYNGDVAFYNEAGERTTATGSIDSSADEVYVSDDGKTAAVAWFSETRFGIVNSAGDHVQRYKFPSLRRIAPNANHTAIAATTANSVGTGSVGVVKEDTVGWESPFEEARGTDIAISESGGFTVVSAASYYEDQNASEPSGVPGIYLYDASGTMRWVEETDSIPVSVDFNEEADLIVAGTESFRLIALSTNGRVLWEKENGGAAVTLSDDGSTVVAVTEDGLAVYDGDGTERWTKTLKPGAVSVSEDGDRIIVTDPVEGTVTVYGPDGTEIWHDEFGKTKTITNAAISDDGSTWSVTYYDKDEDEGGVEVYYDNDA